MEASNMPPPQQFSGTLVALAFASGFLFARAYGGGGFRRAVERSRRALAPGDLHLLDPSRKIIWRSRLQACRVPGRSKEAMDSAPTCRSPSDLE